MKGFRISIEHPAHLKSRRDELALRTSQGETIDWVQTDREFSVSEEGRRLLEELRTVAGRKRSRVTGSTGNGTAFLPGELVAGRFRVKRFIARGGMGEVYLVEDELLSSLVALKTVRAEVAANPVALRRFRQEVLLARSVTHVNVCRIYEFGWHKDDSRQICFLTMEYLQGETLQQRLATGGALPHAEICSLAEQMSRGLDAAHRLGIVHRDFKPQNVMLVPSNDGPRVVVMDFGLALATRSVEGAGDSASTSRGRVARETDTHAASLDEIHAPPGVSGLKGAIVGTPIYMAPEQLRDEPIGPATDLYALGLVLFEMATGHFPFVGADTWDIARARLEGPPRSLRELADVDARLERVIDRLLERDPVDRFTSAGEAMRALSGHPVDSSGGQRLPGESDPFVGRAGDLAELRRRLEGEAPATKLLSLTGLGGCGKTRLALHYAWESRERWPGGCWFCDLSDARDAEGVIRCIARALGMHLQRGDPLGQIADVISGLGRALIILDNFEQVVSQGSAMLSTWLSTVPGAHFLVTSRERLRISGESVIDLSPLDVQSEAIDLFEHRVREQQPHFSVDASNRSVVAQIVGILEGLPLAIELAAARMRLLGLDQVLDRLQNRLSVLSGGKRGRHETLRSTLDWSWSLLEAHERSALVQLAIFEGGCSLDAAESVVDLEGCSEAPGKLDVLQCLVDKSWLKILAADECLRFDMYATVKEYIRSTVRLEDHSVDSPERSAIQRHFEHYLRLAEDGTSRINGPEAASWRSRLRDEQGNLLAVFDRELRDDIVVEDRLRLAARLGRFWESEGAWSTCLRLFRELDSDPRSAAASDETRLALVLSAANAARCMGEYPVGIDLSQRTIALARLCADDWSEAAGLNNLGAIALEQGDLNRATPHMEQALAIAVRLGKELAIATISGNLGAVEFRRGSYGRARHFVKQALESFTRLGVPSGRASQLSALAGIEGESGNHEESARYAEQAIALFRELGDAIGLVNSLENLAASCHHRRDPDRARSLYADALEIARAKGYRWGIGNGLYGRGLAALDGDSESALSDFREAFLVWRELKNEIGIAEVLEASARARSNLGDVGQAARLLGAADGLRAKLDAPVPACDLAWIERVRATCQRQLGEDAEIRERMRGEKESLDVYMEDASDRGA